MIKRVILILGMCLLVTGCGQATDEIKQVEYKAPIFELDDKSIKDADENKYIKSDNNIQKDNEANYVNYRASEIILVGSDKSVNYSVDGTDIVYKGVRFKNLYRLVTEIEQPYEVDTFINFLIKTFNAHGNTEVNVELYKDNNDEYQVSVDGGAPLTLHDSLSDYDGYTQISNKYNDKAVWNLSIYIGNREHLASLYGCKSFMLYNGTATLEIDMSKFYRIKEDISNETETTEETTVESEVNNID